MAENKKLSFDYKKAIKKVSTVLLTYRVILTALILLVVFSFVVLRTNSLLDPSVNQDRYDEQSTTLKKVTFDEEAIKDIQQLVDSGIDISSQFVDRDNPFAEN